MELTTIVTAVGGIGAAVGSYFIARYKGRTDSFKSIIDANESFREEIRKDLVRAKDELSASTQQIEALQKEVTSLRQALQTANVEIDHFKDEQAKAKLEREELIKRIVNYEIEVTRLRTISGQYEAELITMRRSNADLLQKLHSLKEELQKYQASK